MITTLRIVVLFATGLCYLIFFINGCIYGIDEQFQKGTFYLSLSAICYMMASGMADDLSKSIWFAKAEEKKVSE